jgi:hypothetical protein
VLLDQPPHQNLPVHGFLSSSSLQNLQINIFLSGLAEINTGGKANEKQNKNFCYSSVIKKAIPITFNK